MFEKEAEIKSYIQDKEQAEWKADLVGNIAELTSLEEEVKDWFLSEWIRNDKGLLSYAELAMKKEDLSFWESTKFNLLDIKLSLTCSYFSDFKNFLNGLKNWNDTSDKSSPSSTESTTESQTNVDSSKSNTETMDWKVESAVQWALSIAGDNSYWYELWGTGKSGKKWYDCQSLVRGSFIHAWLDVPPSWWCATMRKQFEKVWFEWIPLPKSKEERKEWAIKNAKKWDIFLQPSKHTELYVWNGKIVWAHSNKDGKGGDSSWEEISVRDIKKSLGYRNPEWILRYKW